MAYTKKGKLAEIETKVNALPTDPADQSDLEAILGTPADTDLATDIANLDTVVDGVETKVDTIDGNVDSIKVMTDMLPTRLRKELVFASNDTGSKALFTVVGAVKIKLIAYCVTGLTSDDVGTITVQAGTTALIPTTTGTDLVAGEIWYDATPTTKVDAVASAELQFVIADGSDITLEIANTIDSGAINFCIEYESLGGSIVVAGA